jgi:uncharacterized protein YndB with AHSA1/START domain
MAITIHAQIAASIEKIWRMYTDPEYIVKWNHASDDWHTTYAEADLRPEGRFKFRMEAKDGSDGFDFSGEYNEVIEHKLISYTMDDGRQAFVKFDESTPNEQIQVPVAVTLTFDPETIHSEAEQKEGWQAILNNFKEYVESAQ